MKVIPKPIIKAEDVFLDCISTVHDVKLKQAYTACQDIIQKAEVEFDTRFPLYELYQIKQNLTILGNIGKEEMIKVYDYRMVKAGMPGNKYYNIIKSSATQGKCPFCSVRQVDTLDHYLPKSKYPIFSVTPLNLVPACSNCNTGKKISFPSNDIEQTLHPYYDDIEGESCIKANVLKTNPVSFDYYVDCPNHWSQIKKGRVQNHFDSFKLNELFTSHANQELIGSKLHLQKLFSLSQKSLLEHLQDAHDSRRVTLGINSWQSVMYLSLLNDMVFHL